MDCNFILQQGSEGKYRITFNGPDFHPDVDDFKVVLSWGFRKQSVTIEKSQMEQDYEGKWFFVFDSSEMLGQVMATCTYYMPDGDQGDGIFERTDRQLLCFVTTNPQPKLLCVKANQCGRWVSYERILSPDEELAYQYLTTSNGEYVTTVNDENLVVSKS